MAFVIREVVEQDRAGREALWSGYHDFYETALDPVVLEVTWARFLDPATPMLALIAVDSDDGEALGIVHCVFHNGTWAINELCYLEDLFVAADARKLGVGRGLIEAVYARAEASQCARVYWLTHETNYRARQLYDTLARRTGFIQYRHP